MFNYVAINLTDYLAAGPLRDPSPSNIIARTPLIQETATIAFVRQIPVGFGLAVCLAGLIWWILARTTLEFEIETIGRNPHTAHDAAVGTGLRPLENGRIWLAGKPMPATNPRAMTRAGLTHIPEDRLKYGLVLSYSIADNQISCS